jgi:two-component system invasion response regulator UvrY
MANILIADHHPIIRMGLKTFIENFLPQSIIEEAFDEESTFDKIKDNDFHLIILDVNIPGPDSFALVTSILRLKPDSKILIFSTKAEDIYAKRLLELGIKGYLAKSSDLSEIKKAIENILLNKKYLSATLIQLLTDQTSGKNYTNPFDTLSVREFEVAQHLLKGETVTEISGKFNLAKSTISTYKKRIFEKLNCRNIIAINSLAMANSVVPAAN